MLDEIIVIKQTKQKNWTENQFLIYSYMEGDMLDQYSESFWKEQTHHKFSDLWSTDNYVHKPTFPKFLSYKNLSNHKMVCLEK